MRNVAREAISEETPLGRLMKNCRQHRREQIEKTGERERDGETGADRDRDNVDFQIDVGESGPLNPARLKTLQRSAYMI